MVLDDTWLAAPPRRSRARLALLGLLAATLLFWAGVEVQQRYGVAGAAVASTGPAGTFTPPTGAFGGPGSTSGGDTTTGDGQTSVIGTVVSVKGDVWTVKDFGGKTHRIRVGADARVVEESAVDRTRVAAGTTVAVSGTTDDQGDLTAATVTLRGAPE